MKFRSLLFLALMVGPTLMIPSALAAEVTLIGFITPAGRGIGETVDIYLEVFQYADRADPQTVSIRVGQPFPYDLVVERVSLGRYHTTYTIQAADLTYGYLDVDFTANMGAGGYGQNQIYPVQGLSFSSGQTTIAARLVNWEDLGPAADPGETVTVEAREYRNGTLVDGGPLNATVRVTGGMSFEKNLTTARVGDGTYRTSYPVPTNITNTTVFTIFFRLGDPYYGASGGWGFVVDPITALATVRLTNPSTATVEILAGSTGPLAGASVSVGGVAFLPPFITSPIASASATTDALGAARLTATLPTGFTAAYLTVNVTHGGLTMWRPLYISPNQWSEFWMPAPPYGSGFMAWLVSDPTSFEPGGTATLKIQVAQSYAPLPSKDVTYYLWRGSGTTVLKAVNATTDAQGNLSITYAIPTDWARGESLEVQVDAGLGYGSFTVHVQFDPQPPVGDSVFKLGPTAAARGAPMQVTAKYTGGKNPEGTVALAYLVPGNHTAGALSTAGPPSGLPTQALLARDRTSFSGTILIPSWYPEGDYVLIVYASNVGSTLKISDQINTGNFTVVHVGPAGSLSTRPSGGGLLPGATVLAAAMAVAVAAVASRRRVR